MTGQRSLVNLFACRQLIINGRVVAEIGNNRRKHRKIRLVSALAVYLERIFACAAAKRYRRPIGFRNHQFVAEFAQFRLAFLKRTLAPEANRSRRCRQNNTYYAVNFLFHTI